MDTSLENHSQDPDAILKLIKNAIGRSRESSSQLCGFARGLEIGISTLQGSQSNAVDSINRLQERSVKLSASRDDYHLGVALGLNLAINVAWAMFTPVPANCLGTVALWDSTAWKSPAGRHRIVARQEFLTTTSRLIRFR